MYVYFENMARNSTIKIKLRSAVHYILGNTLSRLLKVFSHYNCVTHFPNEARKYQAAAKDWS